jgi:hypothetical protein
MVMDWRPNVGFRMRLARVCLIRSVDLHAYQDIMEVVERDKQLPGNWRDSAGARQILQVNYET